MHATSMPPAIYRNIAWSLIEKIMLILNSVLISAYVAEYAGPEIIGMLSFSAAIFQVLLIIAQWGGENTIPRNIAKKNIVAIMGYYRYLRGGIFLALTLPTVVVLIFAKGYREDFFIILLAVAMAYFCYAIDILAVYNNASLNSFKNTIANTSGLLVSIVARYVIVKCAMAPVFLAVPIVMAALVPLLIRFQLRGFSFPAGAYDPRLMKYVLRCGFSVFSAGLSIVLYSRVNFFVIEKLMGLTAVGIYSVAFSVATIISNFTAPLITSFYTEINQQRNPTAIINKTISLMRISILVSATGCCLVLLSGKWWLLSFFGQRYAAAYQPMLILCCATIISSLGSITFRFILKFSGFAFVSIKMLGMLLLSIPLSFVAVQHYGLNGAACSVLITEVISLTIANYLFNNGIVCRLHAGIFCGVA